jgi:hypothetical protein
MVLLVLMTSRSPVGAGAQSNVEGAVWLNPPLSTVAGKEGPFTVYVVLEDLQHFGVLTYDDNRDTMPDRQVESDGLAAFEVTIQYDNTVLAFVRADEGPELGRTGRAFTCLPAAREIDSVSFGCVSAGGAPAGPQGTMTLASITFEPVGTGTSPLMLEAGLSGPLGSDTIPVDVRGGVARVSGPPSAKGTVQPPAATSSRATPVGGASPTVPAVETEPASGATATPREPSTGGRPDDLVTGGQPGDDGDDPSALDGDNASSQTGLWLGIALGGASAVIFLALAATLWRRNHRAGM